MYTENRLIIFESCVGFLYYIIYVYIFTALTITKPHFSGEQFGYQSFMSYPNVPELNFDLEIRFKFALNAANNETTLLNSIMFAAGQKGG